MINVFSKKEGVVTTTVTTTTMTIADNVKKSSHEPIDKVR